MPRRIFLVVAGLVVLTGCTRSVSHAYTTQTTTTRPPATTTLTPVLPVAPAEPIVFAGAGFDLHTAGRVSAATFDATWAGVLATLNRYLDAAVVTPLRSGGPAGDLRPLFTKPAADRVTASGADRNAFIDEGLPPVLDLRKQSAVARLTALAGTDGTVSVVTALLDLRLLGQVDGQPVTIVRTGELVLVPDGGVWRIDAYDLQVTRTQAKGSTTTTARS